MPAGSYRVDPRRIPDDGRRYIRVCGAVVFLACSWAAFVIWNANEVAYETRLYTAWTLSALLAGAGIGAIWISFRDIRRQQLLSVEFVLDQATLTARRVGWPDVSIKTDDITKVFEHPRRGLRVLAASGSWMDIPHEVTDFEELKAKLVRDHTVLPYPGSSIPLAAVLTSLAWMVFLVAVFSRDPRMVFLFVILLIVSHCNLVYRMWIRSR